MKPRPFARPLAALIGMVVAFAVAWLAQGPRPRAREEQKPALLAVALDPNPEGVSRTIVRWDGRARIYSTGDALLDAKGERVPDTRVDKIEEGSVTLRVKNAPLVLTLDPP